MTRSQVPPAVPRGDAPGGPATTAGAYVVLPNCGNVPGAGLVLSL